MFGSLDLSMHTRDPRAPHSTIWFLLSSFLNAIALSVLAAATCTENSLALSSSTSAGTPPSSLTRFLVLTSS